MVELLERVCLDVVQALSASGAGVSVMANDGVHGMAAASDPSTARIEELQFTLGEGPCIDAFASGRPVLVSDLADGATIRWPMYTPAVRDAGVRAVFAFPLQIGAARLGVLDVFRTRPGSLSRAELGQAFTFADLMVMTLLDGQERADVGEFDEVFEHRAELFQAQGMVMVQLGIPLTDALVRIRAHAYASNRPLSEVAADIVARRLRFNSDHA
ncbi:GAF and ANTAR domain-containing protein [Dactylosporangium roseum]|uniref:GAF and ANTAR domain-containing protein n=2 Tax=Dactylosporangium roseum TaxID=47989 RepID=A0ABY5ZCL2_9ACTN|nr:GAF and ANTAR domain-containing protein [Dactylosporangium roseum]UWZ39602.1 GAF and ANTAR domain-containing protein [Dactylosporangium roseum]